MASLKILLLGAPQLSLGDEPIVVDTRKAIALLAYLATTAEMHTRETLSTLLYPDYDATRGRAALRRTLSTLTKAIGAAWLQTDRLSIRLVADESLFVDTHRFLALVERHRRHEHAATTACAECQT